MIALIDYHAGNLTSVRKALATLGAEVLDPRRPGDLRDARAIIVPGVGHFQATAALDEEWRRAILESLERGRPLLGICLGLQWLFEGSPEAPGLSGLGLMPGECVRLGSQNGAERLKVPHVGWNDLRIVAPSRLLAGVPDGSYVYFTHSYAAPVTDVCVAETRHGEPFASVVERDLVAGVQFHPEKSGDVGLRILRNFLALAGEAE